VLVRDGSHVGVQRLHTFPKRVDRADGAEVRHLPAYSPDLNPIEVMFSKVKEALRSAAARTVDALIGALGDALRSVTASNILGWFQHSGYRYVQ
jgi:transposase